MTPCKDCSIFLLKETILNVYVDELGSIPRGKVCMYMCMYRLFEKM